jgi:hypothetical protein
MCSSLLSWFLDKRLLLDCLAPLVSSSAVFFPLASTVFGLCDALQGESSARRCTCYRLLLAIKEEAMSWMLQENYRLFILLVLSLLMACCIGLARIFVGVHYPDDILAGIMSGLVSAGIVALARPWPGPSTEALLRLCARLRLA